MTALGLANPWALFVVFLLLVRPREISVAKARRLVPDIRDLSRDTSVSGEGPSSTRDASRLPGASHRPRTRLCSCPGLRR